MPDFQPAFQEYTSEVICILEEGFSQMKLKGNHIKVYPAASHDYVVTTSNQFILLIVIFLWQTQSRQP